MARKFPQGMSVGRGESHHLDPQSGHWIIDEKRFNPSRWKPTTPAEVRALAEKIVTKAEEKGLKDHGQLQEISVRKLAAEEYTVVAGFTRFKAIKLINVDADFRKRLGLKKDEVYPVRCRFVSENEEQALLDNIDENFARFECSPMDKANVVMVLSAKGWSDSRIGKRFGWTANWIGQLKKLPNLDRAHQELVHDGSLGVQGAIDLTDIHPDERDEAIAEARKDNGKISGQAIRANKRDKAIERAEKNGGEVTTVVARSMKEVRKFLAEQADPESGNYDVACQFFKKLLDYTHGKCSERQVLNAVNGLIETEFELQEAA